MLAGAAPDTIESRRIALPALFSHAVRHERIPDDPVRQAEKHGTSIKRVDERNLPTQGEIELGS